MVDVSNLCKIKWNGFWIWDNYIIPRSVSNYGRITDQGSIKKEEMNVYVLIRRPFKVKENLKSAVLSITADSRYKLFLNGKYIGRGINRCESYYWYYNTYDVLQNLQTGENVIAIHARYYGVEFAYYNPPELPGRDKLNSGKGGVLFELKLEYDTPSGIEIEYIGSDADNTKIFRNFAEKSDVSLKSDCLGFVEEFDSRKMPKNWNEIEFDDSSWKKPIILDYPIKILIFDENSPLYEEKIHPSEIIFIEEGDDVSQEEDFEEDELEEMDFNVFYMLEPNTRVLEEITVKNKESLLSGDGFCEILNENPKKLLTIMLKFGREMVGYPRIIAEGPPGTIIDIISSEKMKQNRLLLSLMESKRGSRVVLRGGKQFFEQWDWEGFQYTIIKIRNLSGSLKIHEISTNITHMRTDHLGKFQCSDPDLTKLYEVCAYTLLCCAIDGYLDCPSREQRSYLGDAYPEALIANTCFGERRLTKKIIYDAAFGQRKDGITFSFHPGDYQGQCHIIPDYCFYWIQLTKDYYTYYGDEKAIKDLYPHFLRALDWFWKYIDPETGFLGEEVPYWKFIDWSYGHLKPGYNAIFNAQFMVILDLVAEFGEKLGDLEQTKRFRIHSKKLHENLEKIFWDEKFGCYRDYIKDGELGGIISQHTNAYFVVMGIAPEEKWDSILKRVFIDPGIENDELQIDAIRKSHIKHDEVKMDLEKNVLIAQPFFMHFVNRYFDKMNQFDLMFKFFRNGWTPMFKIGSTGTIWETWSKEGSECHAWAATPGYDLPIYVLGVKPIEPGFKKFEITPNLGDLDWANGIVPSNIGDILIDWKLQKDEFSMKFNIPDGSSANFKSPLLSDKHKISRMELNGEVIQYKEPESKRYEKVFNDLTPGNYKFKIFFKD